MTQGVIGVPFLTPEQTTEVNALVRLCRGYDGIEGILNEESPSPTAESETNQFLYYQDGILAGILTLPLGRHIEMLGMVHPDFRRRGIGRALLEAGKAEGRRRNVPTFLLVCEGVSPVAHAFAEATGGTYRFAEHRMKLDPAAFSFSPPPVEPIQLVRAGAADRETLVRLQAIAFEDPEEISREWIDIWLPEAKHHLYIGKWNDETVGLVRVAFEADCVYLCTFGVLPEYRRRGFGRQILEQAIQEALPEGKAIFIEVETENDAALSLYHSCGFQSVATFRYYEFMTQ